MPIRFSNHKDIPKLRQIMKIVFGDNDLFLDRFFQYKYKNNALVYEINNEIVSIAFLLDSLMENKPISYIYGCGTLPQYRGKGFMNEILSYAYQIRNEQNFVGLCLVPASDSLFHYYRSQGFENYFYRKKTNYLLSDFPNLKGQDLLLKPLSPNQYFELRNQEFSTPNSLQWDLKHYELVEKEYVNEKGGFFEVTENQKIVGIGFFYTHHFKTYISELLTKLTLNQIAKLFFNSLETNDIEIYTPGKEECYGMIKWNKNAHSDSQNYGYLSFALD
ncbi:MAG TPA: GNAT family N-acetyltransferase [Bacteroidales bacterium]|nr:GNAT family N-acetyltransferase [Bacteroidales bacterium]HPS71487.1 GNAT family N-acetyltransferase [Bacteroidales bacterium]